MIDAIIRHARLPPQYDQYQPMMEYNTIIITYSVIYTSQ